MKLETVNYILVALILLATMALISTVIFKNQTMRFLAFVGRVGRRNHTGVRILRRSVYRDSETRETFEAWRTVRGWRSIAIAEVLMRL
jgi:hypothetical protein